MVVCLRHAIRIEGPGPHGPSDCIFIVWDIDKVEDVEDEEGDKGNERGGKWPCQVYKLLTTPENKKQA